VAGYRSWPDVSDKVRGYTCPCFRLRNFMSRTGRPSSATPSGDFSGSTSSVGVAVPPATVGEFVAMKVVIQCAGAKRKGAATLTDASGRNVVFIARPDLCMSTEDIRYAHPDDLVEGSASWRNALLAYNALGTNPNNLSPAARLYRPQVYQNLVAAFGAENVFILSAGWGLVRSDFLLPDYNITFSNASKVPREARRPKRLGHPLTDLNQLSPALSSRDDVVHFFGGRDYLSLFRALVMPCLSRIVVHYKGSRPPFADFDYEPFLSYRTQNWHYPAAEAFIALQRT